jgi:hypothetical protein
MTLTFLSEQMSERPRRFTTLHDESDSVPASTNFYRGSNKTLSCLTIFHENLQAILVALKRASELENWGIVKRQPVARM